MIELLGKIITAYLVNKIGAILRVGEQVLREYFCHSRLDNKMGLGW